MKQWLIGLMIAVALPVAERADRQRIEKEKNYIDAMQLHPNADKGASMSVKMDFADIYDEYGIAHGERGEWDQAIDDFTEAIRLRPNFADAYGNRGKIYFERGDFDRAINNYNQAIRLNPNLAEAYFNRGFIYGERSEWGRAIDDYNQAIRLNPYFVDAYYGRAISWLVKGNHDRAREDMKQAQAVGARPSPALIRELKTVSSEHANRRA